MKGFKGFESWDETYVHTKHNEKDRTVLEVPRRGRRKEPWTWVRTHGKGRVFYTAWGHDERTWGHPGLPEPASSAASAGRAGRIPRVAGVRVRRPAEDDRAQRRTSKPFEYVEAKVPFYPPASAGHDGEPLTKMQKPLVAGRVDEAHRHAGRTSR